MGVDDARRSARELQEQLHAALNTRPARTPEEFSTGIRALLLRASDERALSSAPQDIFTLLKVATETRQACKYVFLSCGDSMDKGQATGSFLRKPDGSRLSFGVTVLFDGREPGALVAYRFHLQFPVGSTPQFLRFDLNSEPTMHEPLDEPRYHIHPGSDHIRVQLPPMTPAQVLHKLIYGVRNQV